MTFALLLVSIVIILCVIFNKLSNKIGTPMLLAFIILGMLFGSDGIVKIQFDNYILAEQVCSVALIFIMFYGGFGTKWNVAKPVIPSAVALSSVGTVLTAGLVGLFCFLVLKMELWESFLLGSVISSTDAASVFSILRSKRLNLKYNTASLLEVESGSNDPFSYMLTVIILSVMGAGGTGLSFVYMLFAQILYGVAFGFVIAWLALIFLKYFHISSSGFSSIFLVAVSVVSFAAPTLIGGNGYLSAYIAGIIIGNSRIEQKQELVHFFDGVTGLMQMLLFFLLGLLSLPSQLPGVTITALLTALFLTFVARPAVVFLIMRIFKGNFRQSLLISWAGMRGAASIVFSIMVVTNPVSTSYDIFHIVFFIVLFSILLQGTLLPVLAKKLDMTDLSADVMKTFNDYVDENPVRFIHFALPATHAWNEQKICDIILPPDTLLVLLIRKTQRIVPVGSTVLQAGDILILAGISTEQAAENLMADGRLTEMELTADDALIGKRIADIELSNDLIILIKRNKKIVIPKGKTILQENDVLVLADTV